MACNNLGCALTAARQLPEAVDVLRRAIALAPDFAEAWYNLAKALKEQGKYGEAAAACRRALALRPDRVECARQSREISFRPLDNRTRRSRATAGHSSCGRTTSRRTATWATRCEAACKSTRRSRPFARASRCDPIFTSHTVTWATRLRTPADRRSDPMLPAGRRDLSVRRHIAQQPRVFGLLSSRLRLGGHPRGKPALERAADRGTLMSAPNRTATTPIPSGGCGSVMSGPTSATTANRCSRFPCSRTTTTNSSRSSAMRTCARPDGFTERLRNCTDCWRDTVGWSDEDVARQVRADRIDILVDLTMHMSNGRPLVMAQAGAGAGRLSRLSGNHRSVSHRLPPHGSVPRPAGRNGRGLLLNSRSAFRKRSGVTTRSPSNPCRNSLSRDAHRADHFRLPQQFL